MVSNSYQGGSPKGISEADLGKEAKWGSLTTSGLHKRIHAHGIAHCDESGLAECYVSFYGAKVNKSNYQVIDTDYDNYTIVYNCDEAT